MAFVIKATLFLLLWCNVAFVLVAFWALYLAWGTAPCAAGIVLLLLDWLVARFWREIKHFSGLMTPKPVFMREGRSRRYVGEIEEE